MKRHLLSLGIMILMALTVSAQRDRTEIIVNSDCAFPITVHADGICQNGHPSTTVKFNLYGGGNVPIKVKSRSRRNHVMVARTNLRLKAGHRFIYDFVVAPCGTRAVLELVRCEPIFNGQAYGREYARGRTQQGQRGRVGYNNGNRGQNNGRVQYNSGRGQSGYGQGGGVSKQRNVRQNNNLNLDALLRTLDNEPFDSGKLEIARAAVSTSRGVFSRDVEEIMQSMTFERTKLAFAKFAFDHTIDKENFFIVNDAFTFSSSRRELSRFLQNR